MDPFLIDVSEFSAARPSLAVPDSDVFDDVLDNVGDDQVPAALSESAAATTSTTGQQQRAKSASRDLSASIAAAQPIPTTAELLALDASPQSAKSRRATASRHASLVQASPSATLELKAQTPAAVTVIDITEQRPQRRSQSQSREPVAVAPPASIVAAEPQSVSSKFTNVSKLATKRSSTQFKPPNKRSNSGGGDGGTADEFEFGDNDDTKQTTTRNKQQPKAASTETIDLVTAESSSLDKVKADAAAAAEQTPKSAKKKATADKKRKEAPVVVDIAQPEPTPPPPPAKKPRSAKSVAAVPTPVESSATESPARSSKRPTKTKKPNANQHDDSNDEAVANGGADEWLSAASVSMVLTGGGDSSKRIEEKAKQLGVHVSSDVTTRTTHVVVLSELRTMKVLLGIAQRLWLVQPQWVDDGDDKRGLPVSQKYEVTCFAGARRARTGAAPPLDGVSVWFAGTDTQPPMKDLNQLLKLAGGKVVTAVGKADVVIAGRNSTVWHRGADDEKPVVKENWLLNCVSSWAKEPFEAHFAREVDAAAIE